MLTPEDIKIIKDIVGDGKNNRLQWSKFSPDRSEQYVIRVDTYHELEGLRECVLKDLPKEGKPFPDDTGPVAVAPSEVQKAVPNCPIHGTPMNLKPAGVSKEGRAYKAFWSCPTKNADGSYCRGKAQT